MVVNTIAWLFSPIKLNVVVTPVNHICGPGTDKDIFEKGIFALQDYTGVSLN